MITYAQWIHFSNAVKIPDSLVGVKNVSKKYGWILKNLFYGILLLFTVLLEGEVEENIYNANHLQLLEFLILQ